MSFSEQERTRILSFVREVIERQFGERDMPPAPAIGVLGENRACFVTLHDADGNLRGCIGNLEAFEPLKDNLARNACNAAFSDPRFPPLEAEELFETSIEVSVLTKPERIADPTMFVIGEDGIIMRWGNRSAVFLPQVAPEQNWDQLTTLRYLSQKAGLPPDGWKEPGTEFYTFQAEVFGE